VSFFSYRGSVAALALATCNWHVAEANISRPRHLHREVGVEAPLSFPVQDTRARATGISCFLWQTTTRSFLRVFGAVRALPLG
jgi:hypothetical protein